MNIILDEAGAQVIRIGGKCYHLVGPSDQAPTHTLEDIEESFDTCTECEGSSSEDASSNVSSAEDVSSNTSSEEISSAEEAPPPVEAAKWYWVRIRQYNGVSDCAVSGNEDRASVFYEVVDGTFIIANYGDWGGCKSQTNSRDIAFAEGPFDSQQEAWEAHVYTGCVWGTSSSSWTGVQYYITHNIAYDDYGDPDVCNFESYTQLGSLGGADFGDYGASNCNRLVAGPYATLELMELAYESIDKSFTLPINYP